MKKIKLIVPKPTPEELRQARRERFIAENKAEWIEAGRKARECRGKMGLTLADMAKATGFSKTKLGSFELGKPVGTRKVLDRIYPLVGNDLRLAKLAQVFSQGAAA